MFQRIAASDAAWTAPGNNPVVRALVVFFRAGAILVAVGEIYVALAVFVVAALGVQWLCEALS